MIEGDLISDDLITAGLTSRSDSGIAGAEAVGPGVLYEWLEALERRELVRYIEPGLWIAAEQAQEYEDAFANKDAAARARLVRRLLRYRGAQSPESVAERYLWTEQEALAVLTALVSSGEAALYDKLYYHAKLFDKARMETIKARRRMITTQSPERYASLLVSRSHSVGTTAEKLETALKTLCSLPYPPSVWESVLLPTRVDNYRPEILDALLGLGKYFWRISSDGLSFHPYDDIDWDVDLSCTGDGLDGNEKCF